MTDREQVVVAVVSAAGGRLTGKVRLQKVLYIMDQLGLASGFTYEYHHYGPFSRDVVNATDDAKAFGLLNEEIGRRQSDGAPFSIFTCNLNVTGEAFGNLGKVGAASLMGKLNSVEATVLELAATAHWLCKYEHIDLWREEIIRRKGVKCQQGRLEKAIELLNNLSLPPGAITN